MVSRTPGIHTTQERRLWDVVGGRRRGPLGWHPEAFFDQWRVDWITKRTGDTPGIDQCPCLWRPRDKENEFLKSNLNTRNDATGISVLFQSFVNRSNPIIKWILNFFSIVSDNQSEFELLEIYQNGILPCKVLYPTKTMTPSINRVEASHITNMNNLNKIQCLLFLFIYW